MFVCERTSHNGQRLLIIKDDRPNMCRELHFNDHKARSLVAAVTDGNEVAQRIRNILTMLAKGINPRVNENNAYGLLSTWHTNKKGESYYCVMGENGLFIKPSDAEMILAVMNDFINGLWYLAGSGDMKDDPYGERGREVVLPSGEVGINRGRKPNRAVLVELEDGTTVDYVPPGTRTRFVPKRERETVEERKAKDAGRSRTIKRFSRPA